MPQPRSATGTRFKSAESIYAGQNKALHKAMTTLAGMPYSGNKEYWCGIFSDLLNRRVKGLSDLTLGERNFILNQFQAKYPGEITYNPAVPNSLKDWQKGDQPNGYTQRLPKPGEKKRQLKYILALWGNLGYEPAAIRTMIKKRYSVDDLQFLEYKQISACIGYLKFRCEQAGKPTTYYE